MSSNTSTTSSKNNSEKTTDNPWFWSTLITGILLVIAIIYIIYTIYSEKKTNIFISDLFQG